MPNGQSDATVRLSERHRREAARAKAQRHQGACFLNVADEAESLRLLFAAFVLGFTILLAGCGGDPGSGPVEVKWDRVTCERCRMVLSDRQHSAQVRVTRPDGKSKVLLFDDLGCAVIWLEGQPREVRESPSIEIWVTDWRNGEWIDARTATYVGGQVTPMEYGLGAQPESLEGGLSFTQAKEEIFAVERRFNVHGAHLEPETTGGLEQEGR